MPRRLRTQPRKQARQSRSKATVDALLGGAARVLVRDGYDRASTNHIAAAAGVNIGSLYHYFPSKEAVVAALIDRHLDQIRQLAFEELAPLVGRPLSEIVRGVVRGHVRAHTTNPTLHRVLIQQVPQVERLNPVITLRRQVIERTQHFLEAHREMLRSGTSPPPRSSSFTSLTD